MHFRKKQHEKKKYLLKMVNLFFHGLQLSDKQRT